MAKALVLLATGFEEMEAVIVIDVLRRAKVDVTTASLESRSVMGAHAITLEADTTLDTLDAKVFDVVILPGGQPGANHLRDDTRVQKLVVDQHRSGRVIAAICAAPIALEAAGILAGKVATAFPGYDLPSAKYTEERVAVDGHIVTSRGPGTAFEFALTLVESLVSPAVAVKLRQTMLVAANTP
jgi:4-methyl-5(b-hydroxyethyl)-thiazole monophosphate biosynthesis